MSSPSLEARRHYWDVSAKTCDRIFPETLIGNAQP